MVSKYSQSEEKFKSLNWFQKHIYDHLEDIEEINIEIRSNDEDMFECKLCSFESENKHLISRTCNGSRGSRKGDK